MHIDKTTLPEKQVYCVRGQRTDPEYRQERITAGTQMRDLPEEFQAVAFLLQRIAAIGRSLYDDLPCFQFKRLPAVRGQLQFSPYRDCGSGCQLPDFIEVLQECFFIHNLQCLKAAAVGNLQKSEFPGGPVGPHPAADPDLLFCAGFSVSE